MPICVCLLEDYIAFFALFTIDEGVLIGTKALA
jgi:hypothetical protein